MSWQDERDFEEEAFNARLLREEDDPADYEIGGDPAISTARPEPRDDADLTADAMKALEGRILAAVPAGQRDEVQDLISDLLDLAPGEAMSLEDTRELARRVLTPRRTLTDEEINAYARFYPHHEAADDNDTTSHPCVALGGGEDGNNAALAYVYAKDGGVVISLNFYWAGPAEDDGTGPWAYYGPDSAIPVRVLGGDGKPVYVAAEGVPDLSAPLIASAHQAIGWLARAADPDDGNIGDIREAGYACAAALRQFLAITGHPVGPDLRVEGTGHPGGSEVQGGSEAPPVSQPKGGSGSD